MSEIKPQTPMKMVPRNTLKRDVTLRTLESTAARLKNWSKWGPDDELGTLNYVKPADLIKAAALVRRGKAFSLGLDFNQNGPQRTGWGGRFNPIHTMLATGTDAVAGRQEAGKLRYADDMVTMPLQCGTQWDGLGHIFYGDLLRYLGLRSAAERKHRGLPALALDRDSHDRDHHGRDLLLEGPRRGLRAGQGLRIPVLRANPVDHRRSRLADQPDRAQVTAR